MKSLVVALRHLVYTQTLLRKLPTSVWVIRGPVFYDLISELDDLRGEIEDIIKECEGYYVKRND